MRWIKKGLIFSPQNRFKWMNSHAQVPTLLLKDDRLRVYFATRPKQTLSLTGYVDLDINNLSKIMYVHPEPILELGKIGEFDEHGTMPSSIIEKDGLIFLYYSGWQRTSNVPYNNFTGLAISEDGGNTFYKYKNNPVLGKTETEKYSATSPCAYFFNDIWHMWYTSGTKWVMVNDKYEHTYDIKYAYSKNGTDWTRTGETAIKQHSESEAITKPVVVQIGSIFHMWFCYRGSQDFRNGRDSYRIGYATSPDLKKWQRNDQHSGIDVSINEWDASMIAYPAVTKINDQIIMIYNGNNFGAEGFGYAILKENFHHDGL